MNSSGAQPTKELAATGSSRQALSVYFLRLGTFGFGGPIALAARMQRELVEARGWITPADYLDGLAFAQLAPGPLAAQLAMYLGYAHSGVAGATLAGISFVLPSLVIVVLLAIAYVAYGGLPWVAALFYAIGPCVIGLIAVAATRLGSKVVKRDPLLIAILVTVAIWTAVSQRELAVLFVAAGIVTVLARHSGSLKARSVPCFAPAMPAFPALNGVAPLLVFFAKAGLFVFGSGLAIVPFLYEGVVKEHHWLSNQQFLDAVAVAMITPGPVVITVAFIGYLVAGLKGAMAAAVGIFAPVYLMVVLLAPLFRRYSHNAILRSFVSGVTAAAAGAIAGAVVVLAQRTVHDITGVAMALATVIVLLKWRSPEPLVIAAGALIGVGVRLLRG